MKKILLFITLSISCISCSNWNKLPETTNGLDYDNSNNRYYYRGEIKSNVSQEVFKKWLDWEMQKYTILKTTDTKTVALVKNNYNIDGFREYPSIRSVEFVIIYNNGSNKENIEMHDFMYTSSISAGEWENLANNIYIESFNRTYNNMAFHRYCNILKSFMLQHHFTLERFSEQVESN